MIMTICAAYLLGVQAVTIKVHLPLNNSLQQINVQNLDEGALSKERVRFESRWNYFNNIRTTIAISVTRILSYLFGDINLKADINNQSLSSFRKAASCSLTSV